MLFCFISDYECSIKTHKLVLIINLSLSPFPLSVSQLLDIWCRKYLVSILRFVLSDGLPTSGDASMASTLSIQ